MECHGNDTEPSQLLALSPGAANARGLSTQAEIFEKRWNLHLRDTAKLEDFVIHRTVGVGAFGRVLYVTSKMHRRQYAMKAMKKEKIVRMDQVDRVFAEKRILQSVVHPFMVNLRFVFKTTSYLYIIMPFVQGGEIYSYMRTFKTFSEEQSQFLSGQLVLALQYLHTAHIVYRDLKPENILVECDGYLKITDFGFAKRISREKRTTSFVGTPEYMAPEMLVRARRKQGYTFSVDWWALGVLIYEFVAGVAPFSGSSLLQLFDHIVKGQFEVPDKFSDSLADLVSNLFETDEKKRIGCQDDGADGIKIHRWYANMNWQALLEKKLPPTFTPKCTHENPTSNFDTYDEEPMEQAAKDEYTDLFRHF